MAKADFLSHIQPIGMGDMDELVRLHSIFLNYGEGTRPHFEAALKKPDTVALKCVMDGKMAGFAVYVKGIFLSGGHEDLCEMIAKKAGNAQVWTGDALLVLPEYRRRGMDDAMIDVGKKKIREMGGRYALHELWVHPDGRIPARRTPKCYAGSIDMGEYKDFYVNFDHYGYHCPICKDRCCCSAHVYLCDIGEEADENA